MVSRARSSRVSDSQASNHPAHAILLVPTFLASVIDDGVSRKKRESKLRYVSLQLAGMILVQLLTKTLHTRPLSIVPLVHGECAYCDLVLAALALSARALADDFWYDLKKKAAKR